MDQTISKPPAEMRTSDVVIVGAGPVGTLLAVLLGREGRSVHLIDRWSRTYDAPRAVTFDHEIARILATLGIDSENDPAISYHDELYYWKNAAREVLQIVDWQSTSASGWRVRYWFNQPDLERRLSGIAAQYPSVTQTRGWEIIGLEQDKEGATVTIRRNRTEAPDAADERVLRTRLVIGADGANSFVRDALAIRSEDKGYFFDWLILDTIPQFDYVASRGDEPAQWQLCDPARPTTIVPGGPGPVPGGPARRRWEFMLLPGETAAEMQQPDRAWRLLEPWGLSPANAVLERSAVYRFQARWASLWNVGRCAIAGDAAHLMPPFAGEGMCAGLRDAMALGWRLNGILGGVFGSDVLDSYTTERVEHARHYIDFSQELGRIICIADADTASERDQRMKTELAGRDFHPVATDVCRLGPGIWDPAAAHAGELSVQGVVEVGGVRGRFDQVVGQGWILLGLDVDPLAAITPGQRRQLDLMGGRAVRVGQRSTGCDVVDAEGSYARWLAEIGAAYVLIRPDFYVAATAATPGELRARFDGIAARLSLRPEQVAA